MNVHSPARFLPYLVAVLLAASLTSIRATLVFDLNRVDTTSGGWKPLAGISFAQATFKDHGSDSSVPAGNVDLILQPQYLGGSGFITEWYFEIDNSHAQTLQLLAKSGSGYNVDGLRFQAVGTAANMKQYKLDFGFDFGTSPENRFDAGDIITLRLGVGLDEDWFNAQSEGKGYDKSGGVYTAMKVQGLPGGASARISDPDGGYFPVPVPEPSTCVFAGLLLLPFLAQLFRKRDGG